MTLGFVVEHGLKYQLDIGRNQNFRFISLDMRNGRQWVQDNARIRMFLACSLTLVVSLSLTIAGGAEIST